MNPNRLPCLQPGSISRRGFVGGTLAASVGAFLRIATEPELAFAQSGGMAHPAPPGAVFINANENPLGPSAEACAAIATLGPRGGRYQSDLTRELVKTFAELEGLKPDYVRVYAGSTEPLHYTVLAFTSPQRSLVIGDPSFEGPLFIAAHSGAEIHKIPLAKDYSHDVKAMIGAGANAGVFYICNPNNPTGTVTSRADIEYMLAHKPQGSILLVDEAYIHFSDAQTVLDLSAADKDIVVLRTFSKIYGMAGLRCGFAVARPDLLAKLDLYGSNFMPVPGVIAALASLGDKNLVPERKKINADIRSETFSWLTANNFSFVPSETNCFLVDAKRPGKSFIDAMEKKNVYIGRVWPIWPTHVRVTVGTQAEMIAFRKAFKGTMENPAPAS